MPPASPSLMTWLRRGLIPLLLFGALLLPGLVARSSPDPRPAWLPRVESQRVDLLGRVGGLVSAGIPLGDDTALMAEGSSLVRIRLTDGESRVLSQADLDHGIILDMTRDESFIYALTEEGVAVLRAVADGLPQELSFVPGSGQAIDAAGGLVVIAAREAGLRVLQIGPDGQVESAAVLSVPGSAVDVALAPGGRMAYVAAGGNGAHLVDLSDPASPLLRGTLPQLTPADAIGTAGSLLVVGSGERALIADPVGGSNAVLGVYSPLRAGRRIVANGDYLYVADAVDGLKVLRLVSTEHPVQVYGEAGRPVLDLLLDGETLYLAGPDGLRVLDVSDDARPREMVHMRLPGEPQGLALGFDRLYVALGSAGAAEIDIFNPAAPSLLRTYEVEGVAHDVLFLERAAFNERVLYVAAGEAGLVAIDLNPLGGGTVREPFALPGPALDIARRGNALFVAGGETGLIAVDISFPGVMSLAGVLAPSDGRSVDSVMITGKRAYLGEGDRMAVVDVSFADSMGRLTLVPVPATHVASRGVYLYVLHGDRITVFDARATSEPVFMRAYYGLGRVSRIATDGTRAYLAGAGDGPVLVALDLSLPDRPAELDSLPALGAAHRPWPDADGVWLARGYEGLSRYRLSASGLLEVQGQYSISGEVGQITAGADWLLAGGRGGWALLGLNGERLPEVLALAPDPLPVRGVATNGEMIGVAAGESGVALYNLGGGQTGQPVLITQREARGSATGIALDERFVYVADADGLSIYDNRYLQPVTRVALPAPPTDIVRKDHLAYFPLEDGQLAVVDLADPTGGLRVHSILQTRRPTDLFYGPDGETVYALEDDRLIRLRVDPVDDLMSVGFSNLRAYTSRGAFGGGWLWTLQPGSAIHVYDASPLPDEQPVHRQSITTRALEFAMRQNITYLALGEDGLALLDVTVPEAEIVFYEQPVRSVYLDGNILFAAGESLTAWDVSDRVRPTLLAEMPLAAPGRHVDPAPAGLLVSLANGFVLVNWENGRFTQVGQLSAAGEVDRGVQMGDRAFLAMHQGGLLVVDLTDPANPVRLYSYTSAAGQFVNDLLPLDEGTLLVSWEGGIEALDVSQIEPTPRLVNTLPVGDSPVLGLTLAPDGARAAAALGEGGVVLLSLADAVQPEVIGFVDTPGDALQAALDGNDLYVADGICGLRVVDVSNPASPQERGYWRSSYASDVVLSGGGHVYLAEANQLLTLRYDPNAPPVLPPIPQFPEPFDGRDGAPLELNLSWGPPPHECDTLTYKVYFGVTSDPPFLGVVQGEPTLRVADLDPMRTYRWRVEVTDRQGDTIQGPVWRFTTVAADYPDSFPPAPPALVERVRQNPMVPFLLGAGALLAVGLGVFVWRRRRGAPPPDRSDWTYTDEE